MGVAEIDDANAAMTARAIAEKRIVSEVKSDTSEVGWLLCADSLCT